MLRRSAVISFLSTWLDLSKSRLNSLTSARAVIPLPELGIATPPQSFLLKRLDMRIDNMHTRAMNHMINVFTYVLYAAAIALALFVIMAIWSTVS